jgi:hypothetical protein
VRFACGVAWAESQSHSAVTDDTVTVPARRRIDARVKGFGELMSVLAEHTDDPTGSCPLALETDKNLIVVALQAAGLTVHAINPRATQASRKTRAKAA